MPIKKKITKKPVKTKKTSAKKIVKKAIKPKKATVTKKPKKVSDKKVSKKTVVRKKTVKKLKVLFVTSECVPFAKTGGLADVAGSLPSELCSMNIDARVILPKYKQADEKRYNMVPVAANVPVNIRNRVEKMDILESVLNKTTYYLIKKDRYFDRDELYQTSEGDYPDNCERFTFFSRSVIEACKAIGFKPDIIHCNDWQTGLIPVYLKTIYKDDQFFKKTKTVFTIHNIAYQGLFWHYDLPITGLNWDLFTYDKLEFYGKLNYMKGGIVFADKITTVSEKYAEEIQTREYGYGLENVLRFRKADLSGIINGVDYNLWSPQKDKFIIKNFSNKTLSVGKKACKKDLQILNDLTVDMNVPVIGLISRLTDQKGFDILTESIEKIMNLGVQFILLGTGDKKYHDLFENIKRKYPNQAAINLTFNNELAHKIEAGADIFLMPSKYEPCGLNQLYSMKYGTIPVVRKTGGLADTVESFDVKKGKGTGFVFEEYSANALLEAVEEAVSLYKNNKKSWKLLQMNAMKKNYSWKTVSKKYIELYKISSLPKNLPQRHKDFITF